MILVFKILLVLLILATINAIIITIKTINIVEFKDIIVNCRKPSKVSIKKNKKK